MRNQNKRVAIIGGARIPFVKSFTNYRRVRNRDLLTAAVQALVKKYKLEGKKVDDVVLGTLIHYPSDWNYAREVVLSSGLDPHTPALFHARACGTSLDAANTIALKIATGQIAVGIAGGCDTNSDVPLTVRQRLAWQLIDITNSKSSGARISKLLGLNPFSFFKLSSPSVTEPRTGLNMGQHTELTVKEWDISREAQDELALESHRRAAKAYEEGFYKDLVFPFKVVEKDLLVRPDSTIEKLGRLKPAFDKSEKGSLTAGNSSAFTDGASSLLMTSEEYAKNNGLKVASYLVDVQVASLDYVGGEALLLAPTVAVSELMRRNNLTFDDFDYFEIHEAFAGQVLATLKAWEDPEYNKVKLGRDKPLGKIDRAKMNVKGGSVAIGHPFSATGTRVLANASKLVAERKGSRCLVSVCTAGGMGVAAIVESGS